MPKAASLAEEIKKRFGIDPKMIEGRGGIFDVKIGDELIYSKHQTGEFPEDKLILDRIASAS